MIRQGFDALAADPRSRYEQLRLQTIRHRQLEVGHESFRDRRNADVSISECSEDN